MGKGCLVSFVGTGLAICLIMLVSAIVSGINSSPTNQEPVEKKEINLPESEIEFIENVIIASNYFISPKNPMQSEKQSKERYSNLCSKFKVRYAKNWIGEISKIDTAFNDGVILKVKIKSGMYLSTNDGPFSDVGQGTLIMKNTNLYNDVYDLGVGDLVIFSGKFMYKEDQCIDTNDFLSKGDLNVFRFTFKFNEIKKYNLPM